MLSQTQAVAIILEYDTIPVALLSKLQKAALAAAKDVNNDTASRAVAEFIGLESSKKYFNKPIVTDLNLEVPHHEEKELPITTINELHD